jgi:hypothetical protein
MSETKITFASPQLPSDTYSSPVGSPVYEWEYLDADGKVQREKQNVQEKIQSYERQTRYKELFEKGELENDGSGLYMDITKLGDDYSGLDEYFSGLVNRLKAEVQSRKTENQGRESNNEGAKNGTESAGIKKEVPASETGGSGK